MNETYYGGFFTDPVRHRLASRLTRPCCFRPERTRAALGAIEYGMTAGELIVITGEVGLGKTTVLQGLSRRARSRPAPKSFTCSVRR